jgi:formylglycine-generating enzyme required for sulfatase activity
MKLKLIPAGEFLMGSPDSEEHRYDDEKQHRVRITQPFYMGAHEVTQSQYEQVIGNNPSAFSSSASKNLRVTGQDTRQFPVETVSWYDAVEFCNKLSSAENQTPCYRLASVKHDSERITKATVTFLNGTGYRLPTEAEWEYACRAGTQTPFSFGSVLNGKQANVDGNKPYGTATKGPYLKRTARVGQYGENAFGLFDMHGNVWEWCQDVYDSKAYESRSGVTQNPLSTSGSEYRVLRGGSWYFYGRYARSAYRFRSTPDFRSDYFGFRVVLSVGARTRNP